MPVADSVVRMSWPDEVDLSAGLAVLIAIIAVFVAVPRAIRWPTLLVLVGWSVIPLVRGHNSAERILPVAALTTAGLVATLVVDLVRRPARISRDAVLTIVSDIPLCLIWLQIGAPFRLAAIILLVCVPAFAGFSLVYRRHMTTGDGNDETRSIRMLIARDSEFLEGLYHATSGQVGRSIPTYELIRYLKLPVDQAIVAGERLLANGYIEENGGTYALRPEGLRLVEDQYRSARGVTMVNSGDNFTFNSPATGVFGRQNQVTGNTFASQNVSPDLINAVLSQAATLKAQLPGEQQAAIANAVEDIQGANGDEAKLGSGAGRLIAIAKAAGEIGAPLVRVAGELIKAIAGA